MDGWARKETLFLIRELKKFPCLYSPADINFANKSRRSEKLKLICDQLKLIRPFVTIGEIKKKIKSLRSQLWKEKQKMLNYKSSGSQTDEMYTPKLWCYSELSFLLYVNDSKPNKTNIDLSEFQLGIDKSMEELEENLINMENSKIPSQKKISRKTHPLEEESFLLYVNDSKPGNSNIDLSELNIDKSREELKENLINMEKNKIPSQKKRKCTANPLEAYDTGAIEFMKNHFELRPIKQVPLQKEEEFCRYLCSLLKKIKLEETFDHLTLEILVLVKNTTTEERKQLQSENNFCPMYNSQSCTSPSFSSSKPHPIMTISASRNCPDTSSSSNHSNTSSPITYPSLDLCDPQNIKDPIYLESRPQTPISISSRKSLGLSSTLTIESFPQAKNIIPMYKIKPQTLHISSSANSSNNTATILLPQSDSHLESGHQTSTFSSSNRSSGTLKTLHGQVNISRPSYTAN